MEFKNLFTEDRAVSPVIGVILMVAITVILAAVIGTFVLGLGDQVSESSPQAQFTFDFNENSSNAEYVTITHDGGDSIDSSTLEVKVGGTTAWENNTVNAGGFNNDTGWSKPSISAGSTLRLNDTSDGGSPGPDEIDPDEDIRVIWNSPNSDSSATIARTTAGF